MVLRFGDRVATGTFTDTPESRQFAAMLPATVDLKHVWAQAKSGRLPHAITVEGAMPVHDPVPGGIYFWRLGTIDTGLDDLAGAGRRIAVRITLAAVADS
jgi:hypothetical protein